MSTAVEKDVFFTAKEMIERNHFDALQSYWSEIQETEFPHRLDWVVLFQKLYIHACLRKRHEIATWFQTVLYPTLDPIQQIAVRQVFAYGNYLLRK